MTHSRNICLTNYIINLRFLLSYIDSGLTIQTTSSMWTRATMPSSMIRWTSCVPTIHNPTHVEHGMLSHQAFWVTIILIRGQARETEMTRAPRCTSFTTCPRRSTTRVALVMAHVSHASLQCVISHQSSCISPSRSAPSHHSQEGSSFIQAGITTSFLPQRVIVQASPIGREAAVRRTT